MRRLAGAGHVELEIRLSHGLAVEAPGVQNHPGTPSVRVSRDEQAAGVGIETVGDELAVIRRRPIGDGTAVGQDSVEAGDARV